MSFKVIAGILKDKFCKQFRNFPKSLVGVNVLLLSFAIKYV